MQITDILRSNGEFEWTRVLGTIGVAAFILVGNGLVIYQSWYLQKPFDIVAYCAAFPAGLAVAVGAIATAAGVKDRNVAAATTVTNTGSQPAIPPAPAPQETGELPEGEKLP